jgi:hypothetical protein
VRNLSSYRYLSSNKGSNRNCRSRRIVARCIVRGRETHRIWMMSMMRIMRMNRVTSRRQGRPQTNLLRNSMSTSPLRRMSRYPMIMFNWDKGATSRLLKQSSCLVSHYPRRVRGSRRLYLRVYNNRIAGIRLARIHLNLNHPTSNHFQLIHNR